MKASAADVVLPSVSRRNPVLLPLHSLDGDEVERRDDLAGAKSAHFPSRAMIFQEGDRASAIFQITDGVVMLYQLLPDGRRQVIEFLRPGDIFGFSDGAVHDCTAETLLPTSCAIFERAELGRCPALAQRLNASLLSQVYRLQEHLMLLGRKSATERMASFLMRLIPGRGRGRCPGPPSEHDRAHIPLPMTRLEIGDFLGLTIETVSRVLTRFTRRGILSGKELDAVDVADVCRLCGLSGTHLVNGRWCSAQGEMRRRDSVAKA